MEKLFSDVEEEDKGSFLESMCIWLYIDIRRKKSS